MLNIRKVVLGVSGGVDSAVVAILLKNKGYNVEGIFMQNWDLTDENGYCSADEDYKDAAILCDKLKIKLHHVNFVKEYWNEVFSPLIQDYQSGRTPNPDILCNRNVKFNHLYRYAMNKLNADAVATGHYASTSFGPYLEHYRPKTDVKLLHATDKKKDQTFFLCQISQEALRRTMFPLANLTKSEVKHFALENGLEKFAGKRESMGICFIGSRNFQDFIQEYIDDKPGVFVDVDTGKIVGKHKGIHQWTIGQRARLQGLPEPYFTAKKDVENNIIYVAQKTNHPILYSNLMFTSEPHWICGRPEGLKRGEIIECNFKFQHTELMERCQVCEVGKGLVIKLDKAKRALTPGQYAVLWRNEECLGSAVILNAGVSHFSYYYLNNRKHDQLFSKAFEEIKKLK